MTKKKSSANHYWPLTAQTKRLSLTPQHSGPSTFRASELGLARPHNHHDCLGLVLPCAVRVRLTPGVRRPWPRYGAIFTSMSFLVLARFAAFALARLRHRILPSVNQRRCTLGLRTAPLHVRAEDGARGCSTPHNRARVGDQLRSQSRYT